MNGPAGAMPYLSCVAVTNGSSSTSSTSGMRRLMLAKDVRYRITRMVTSENTGTSLLYGGSCCGTGLLLTGSCPKGMFSQGNSNSDFVRERDGKKDIREVGYRVCVKFRLLFYHIASE